MARSTINLDNLPKLQRWAGKQTGERMSISQVLDWLETDAAGDLKSQLHPMLVRDTVRLGSVDNLLQIQALGYDLTKTCSYQVDGNALHVAAQNNRQAHAMALVSMGLSVTQRFHNGGPSALDEALTNGHLALFKKLLPHAGKVSDSMKTSFLLAAGSNKIHAPGHAHDAMKKKVLRYVIGEFGPYPQPLLDHALRETATNCWPLSFQQLVELGANPCAKSSFMRSWGHGDTTVLGSLLANTHPKRWEEVLSQHEHLTEALFPTAPEGDSPIWDILRIEKAISSYSTGYAAYNLKSVLIKAQAICLQARMDQRLSKPDPSTPARKGPRL